MLLSGKSAAMAAEDLDAVRNAVGSTDAAFAIASEGIGNKTKMMMNEIQAGFNTLMSSIGSIGQTALATATQIAPLITSVAGLSNLIPAGAVSKVGELGKSLLTKLVPGQVEATSTYNGALEMALAEVPGKSLSDKLRRLSDGS